LLYDTSKVDSMPFSAAHDSSADAFSALGRLAGADGVRDGTAADALDGVIPRWVVTPISGECVAQVLAFANCRGFRIVAQGGGTKRDWGAPPPLHAGTDVLLSLRRLHRIIDHAAGDMTATVQAGCTVAAMNAALAERGQRLAVDPLWPGRATVGGILATNETGVLRGTFGGLRDHLLGATVALADGTLARSGGKVVKNVAGYDLPKLLIGSFGTLGIILEATFRLYPLAQADAMLGLQLPALEALAPVLGALAAAAALITGIQLQLQAAGPAVVLVAREGLSATIDGKVETVKRIAAGAGAISMEPAINPAAVREALFAEPGACVCKVGMLATAVPGFAAHVRDVAGANGVFWRLVMQGYGVGLVQLRGPAAGVVEAVARLRAYLQEQGGGGTLTLLCAPRAIKQRAGVWPDVGDALPVMQRLKSRFDAQGTLSPGRFVGGI
jgi:glycolate oxidase FAD binding subunit